MWVLKNGGKKNLGDMKTKCNVHLLAGFEQINCNKSGSFEYGLAVTDTKELIFNF